MREREVFLLERDLEVIAGFLGEFDPPVNGEVRDVGMNDTGELVWIRNFPLPDGFQPDYVDVLLLTHAYPAQPPIGLYLLERNNAPLIAQLKRTFNVFNQGLHNAPTVQGYAWICMIYAGNAWRYNAADIRRGDNLSKFLVAFFNNAAVAKG